MQAILKFLSSREYQPLKPRQLARQMGVAEADYGTFRDAVKRLRDAGRVVLGVKNALTLPEMGSSVAGVFRANPRGFGFVVPETPNRHGDLFIPPEAHGGALTGDHVVARVSKRGKRGGEMVYRGEVVQIIKRGESRFVGTLACSEGTWFVVPDGRAMSTPIVVRDVGTAGPKPDEKVVVEIVQYPRPGELPMGVIVERLGTGGVTEVETVAVIRAHGLEDEFSQQALADARAVVDAFDPQDGTGREDLTGETVVTIDPPDARDFDDAVSIAHGGGKVTLGVHIADVSHFVGEQTALDDEARRRGTSVYFPRSVLPMLPEVLSNGVCSLQEGVRRFCKSVFITYDSAGNVLASRAAETVIRSAKRLTYRQAQAICDGGTADCSGKVVGLVREMARLAKRIEARRNAAGMLHLELPAVELIFDESDRVVDAVAEDASYTHTVIEMFMVEANEAVARLLDAKGRAFLRRIHPAPDPAAGKDLSTFIRACGRKIPRDLTRKDIQQLLQAVRGRPEEYAVNLAVLRTFQAAEYSPRSIEHFALASNCYCHFTSPIRRYPDLTVHRLIAEACRGTLDDRPPEDISALNQLGADCTAAERRAEAAEYELRDVLVLELLAERVGEGFEGTITGVTSFGIFVQSPRYLIEGLIRMPDLGDDWWEVDARRGQVRGEHTGRRFRIGDRLPVRIAGVDKARRQLNLVPDRPPKAPKGARRKRKKKR
ncbi:MAG: ribonuclease R [Phycisphaerae bacterium]